MRRAQARRNHTILQRQGNGAKHWASAESPPQIFNMYYNYNENPYGRRAGRPRALERETHKMVNTRMHHQNTPHESQVHTHLQRMLNWKRRCDGVAALQRAGGCNDRQDFSNETKRITRFIFTTRMQSKCWRRRAGRTAAAGRAGRTSAGWWLCTFKSVRQPRPKPLRLGRQVMQMGATRQRAVLCACISLLVTRVVATGPCFLLGDCNGHGDCVGSTMATAICSCWEGWGAASDIATYKAPDCSLSTC